MTDDQQKARFAQLGEYAMLIVLAVLVVLALAETVDWRTMLLIGAGL
ncbi:hypothetical protein [Aureimonas leprariae]|nr:hypothetical protein [Aureimonas leprariae]